MQILYYWPMHCTSSGDWTLLAAGSKKKRSRDDLGLQIVAEDSFSLCALTIFDERKAEAKGPVWLSREMTWCSSHGKL